MQSYLKDAEPRGFKNWLKLNTELKLNLNLTWLELTPTITLTSINPNPKLCNKKSRGQVQLGWLERSLKEIEQR